MSYHVSIIRKKGRKITPISKQEWEDFVNKSQVLSFEKLEDGRIYAVQKDDNDQIKFWLDWLDGEVWTQNPDDEILMDMIVIAEQIMARVRGDDGEYYKTATEYYYDPEEDEEREKEKKEIEKYCKHSQIRNIVLNGIMIIVVPILLVLILKSCSK